MVARPDEKWGETPMAFVVLKDGVAWEPGLEAQLIGPREGEGPPVARAFPVQSHESSDWYVADRPLWLLRCLSCLCGGLLGGPVSVRFGSAPGRALPRPPRALQGPAACHARTSGGPR